MIPTNTIDFETPDVATARRAKAFDASSWLKAKDLLDRPYQHVVNETMWKPVIKTDLAFSAPSLSKPRVEGFKSEQEFEGYVIDVSRDTFWARLVDLTGGMPEEEAEFSFSEIPLDDWDLISVGALFSWNIGLEIRNRQVRRVNEIRFRRYFKFSSDAIKKAEEQGEELARLIGEINYNELITP